MRVLRVSLPGEGHLLQSLQQGCGVVTVEQKMIEPMQSIRAMDDFAPQTEQQRQVRFTEKNIQGAIQDKFHESEAQEAPNLYEILD